MTGQMPDIINRIDALKYKAWALLGKEPNTIYMSIADYRRFCEETAGMWIVGADKINYGKGELMARSDHAPRPTQIMLMKIVKRAGEMECAFVPPTVNTDEHDRSLCPEVDFRDAIKMEGAIGDYARSIEFRLRNQINNP